MSKASKIYATLTNQQKDFIKEKNISASFKVGKWLGFLQKVSLYDKFGDAKIKSLNSTGIILIVIGVVLLFGGAISEFFEILLLVPVLIIIAIFLFVKARKLRATDLNNYLRLFFIPILSVLKDKAGEDAKLAASLDFRNPRKALEAAKSKVNGRNLELYKPTYIISKVTLLDGTLLEFVVGDDIKDFNWTKRSASGKTKYKSKTKFVHQCFIKMTLPKSEYRWTGEETPQIQVVDHNGHYFAKQKIKIKTIGKDNVLNVNAFFAAMQSVYSLFDPLSPTAEKPRRSEDESEEFEEDYSAVPYIWYASTFDDYDYDSFDYSDSGEMMMDDDGATVFDS